MSAGFFKIKGDENTYDRCILSEWKLDITSIPKSVQKPEDVDWKRKFVYQGEYLSHQRLHALALCKRQDATMLPSACA
jgi:hypothetical protein